MTVSTSGPPPEITVYTDGGADPNPGPGGWGAVLIHQASNSVKELRGGEPLSTNNRMELTAAIKALESLQRPCRVHLFTDSVYLRKGVTEWLPGWIARGWRRKEGVLQNEDLWRLLSELIPLHEIRWSWIKGHAGNRWNERADQLATQAIREQRAAVGVAPAGESVPVEAEVFLRVSAAKGKGGWAALIRRGGEERVLAEGGAKLSSNQLDLISAATALESLPEGISVAVHTPSDYLRNGAKGWIEGWKRRGWKTQEGSPVLHRALWERLDRALTTRRVQWPPVKGREVPELEALAKPAREAAGGSARDEGRAK